MVNLVDRASALKTIVADLLKAAKILGVSGAEVSLTQQQGLSVSVRGTEVDTVQFNRDKSLVIHVYLNQKKGSATTTDLSSAAVLDCLQNAYTIATHIEADPFNGLVEAMDCAQQLIDCNVYYPTDISVETAMIQSKMAEDSARAFDSRIVNSEGSTFNSRHQYRVYGNTHGFLHAYASTLYSLSSVILAQSATSLEQDFDFTVARAFEDLKSPRIVGQQSASRALSRLNARKIKTMDAPVVLSAEVASTLIGHFASAISGSALYRKTSFLMDSLNKKIFPDFIDLKVLPFLKKGLGSAPIDEEGVTPQARYLVEAGILKGYLLGSYSARKLGLKTTGNCGSVQNIQLSSRQPTFELKSLLKEMGRGLFVTELMGQGVNPLTGDYSRGAFGFWVEGGEIQYPVHEMTIAGNLKQIYQRLVAIGSDIDTRSHLLSGSILCDCLTIAGS